MRRNNRRFLVGIFAAVALPALAASAAYACQRLVTLHANPQSAAAGTAVQVTGVNYNTASTSSNVDIRLDGRNGPVLATIAPASLGSKGDFAREVTIPAGTASGNHILVATQTLSSGAPCAGCPGRANIEVTGASAASNSSAAGPAASSNDQGSGAPSEASQPAPAPEPAASEPAPQPATASQANQPAAQPYAPAAADTAQPAAPAGAQPAAAVKPSDAAPVAPAAAPVEAGPALAATDASGAPGATATAAVAETAPVAPASGRGVALLPAAAGEQSGVMPGLALASALALVLLGVGAFWKSRMTLFGGGNFTPAAG